MFGKRRRLYQIRTASVYGRYPQRRGPLRSLTNRSFRANNCALLQKRLVVASSASGAPSESVTPLYLPVAAPPAAQLARGMLASKTSYKLCSSSGGEQRRSPVARLQALPSRLPPSRVRCVRVLAYNPTTTGTYRGTVLPAAPLFRVS